MKRLFTLAIVLALAVVFAVSVFAAEKTVYIAAGGDDANDGTSYKTPVKTLGKAYELIGSDDGKIIVCSYLNVGSDYKLPAHSGKVTFTATDGKYYFPLGKIAFAQSLTLSGETKFERVGFAASGASFLAAGGNNLTLGKNIEVTGDLVILAGYNVVATNTAEEVSLNNDFTITVLSGEYLYFRGGNRRASGDAPFGNMAGNITINLNGGSFDARDSATNLCAAAGMNNQTGNVTLNINGATLYGSLYAVGRGGTNETTRDPGISGDITINVNSGYLNGKNLNENQDNSIAFSGQYTLNLNGGNLQLIESIKGGDTAKLTIADSLKISGGTTTSTFKNPLRGGADPWVIYRDGFYYMTTVSGVTIYCYKSPTLDGLAYADAVAIWTAPTGNAVNSSSEMYSKEIWSPELHYIEADEFGAEYAGWWLYFAADDGENTNHRLYCVRALTDDAIGQYGSPITGVVNEPVKTTVYNDGEWAIGQSILRAYGTTYMTWTGERGRGTASHHQTLNIAKLINPYTIEGEGNVICVAEYDWETKGYAYNATTGASYPKVVEGATAVYGDNGEILIIYSASGYWTNYYCLATMILKDGADPLLKDSWIKATEPIFQHQNGVFGPGHAAYTTDAAGNRWMIYHAYLDFNRTHRYVFIQPWTLTGTTVDMNGGPYSQNTLLTITNVQPDIMKAVSGFAK